MPPTLAHGMEPFCASIDHTVHMGFRMVLHHPLPIGMQALMEHQHDMQVWIGLSEPVEGVHDNRPAPKRQKLLGDRPVHAGACAAGDENEVSHAAEPRISRVQRRNAQRWRSNRSH